MSPLRRLFVCEQGNKAALLGVVLCFAVLAGYEAGYGVGLNGSRKQLIQTRQPNNGTMSPRVLDASRHGLGFSCL